MDAIAIISIVGCSLALLGLVAYHISIYREIKRSREWLNNWKSRHP